jgi:hypothetical protein
VREKSKTPVLTTTEIVIQAAAAGAMRTTTTTLVFASALALALPLQALGGACKLFESNDWDFKVCVYEKVRFSFFCTFVFPTPHVAWWQRPWVVSASLATVFGLYCMCLFSLSTLASVTPTMYTIYIHATRTLLFLPSIFLFSLKKKQL